MIRRRTEHGRPSIDSLHPTCDTTIKASAKLNSGKIAKNFDSSSIRVQNSGGGGRWAVTG